MEENQATAEDFHKKMLQLYEEAKRLRIYATRFLSEVQQHGGVKAAKRFLLKGDPWDPGQLKGVELLIEAKGGLKNLQYTSEALVLKPQYRHLFYGSRKTESLCPFKVPRSVLALLRIGIKKARVPLYWSRH